MEGKEIPQDVISKVAEKRNTEILENLNAGLRERGKSLYAEDYGK